MGVVFYSVTTGVSSLQILQVDAQCVSFKQTTALFEVSFEGHSVLDMPRVLDTPVWKHLDIGEKMVFKIYEIYPLSLDGLSVTDGT